MNESTIQADTRVAVSKAGGVTWRNNNGVFTDTRGVPVRYGLANESSKLNKKVKSSDLIGITPVEITPAHIGRTLGVFTAIECKPSNWIYRQSDQRAVAQLAYINRVIALGGFAGFCNDVNYFMNYLEGLKK